MGFAQHQSFYCRDRWIEKAFDSFFSTKTNLIIPHESLFENNDNFPIVGLGKNMFESLKYWIFAFGIAEKNGSSIVLTNLGQLLKKLDPVLKHNDTLSILHYNICKNEKVASTWFWFFNFNTRKILSKDEILDKTSLYGWAENNFSKISLSSIKKDILCLIQMYTLKQNTNDPEDTMFSPFSRLNLVVNREHAILKNSPEIDDIGIGALTYVLNEYCIKYSRNYLTVEEILLNENLWGRIYNLNKVKVIEAINKIISLKLLNINFSRTAELNTILIQVENQEKLLEKVYGYLEIS